MRWDAANGFVDFLSLPSTKVQQVNAKIIHLVSDVRMRTHGRSIMSLLLQPQGQGSHPNGQ